MFRLIALAISSLVISHSTFAQDTCPPHITEMSFREILDNPLTKNTFEDYVRELSKLNNKSMSDFELLDAAKSRLALHFNQRHPKANTLLTIEEFKAKRDARKNNMCWLGVEQYKKDRRKMNAKATNMTDKCFLEKVSKSADEGTSRLIHFSCKRTVEYELGYKIFWPFKD